MNRININIFLIFTGLFVSCGQLYKKSKNKIAAPLVAETATQEQDIAKINQSIRPNKIRERKLKSAISSNKSKNILEELKETERFLGVQIKLFEQFHEQLGSKVAVPHMAPYPQLNDYLSKLPIYKANMQAFHEQTLNRKMEDEVQHLLHEYRSSTVVFNSILKKFEVEKIRPDDLISEAQNRLKILNVELKNIKKEILTNKTRISSNQFSKTRAIEEMEHLYTELELNREKLLKDFKAFMVSTNGTQQLWVGPQSLGRVLQDSLKANGRFPSAKKIQFIQLKAQLNTE